MDSSDSESLFVDELVAVPAKNIVANRHGLNPRQAAGCGMGRRKASANTRFTAKDDMDIIKYMVQVAYPKYKFVGTWASIVDCVAAHPKLDLPYHTPQSVHERFRRNIRRNIEAYNIPVEWKELLSRRDGDERIRNYVPPANGPRYGITPNGRVTARDDQAGTSRGQEKPHPHRQLKASSKEAYRTLAGKKGVHGKSRSNTVASSVDGDNESERFEVASLHPVKNLGQKRRLTHLSTSEDEGPVRVEYYKVERPAQQTKPQPVIKRKKPFVLSDDDDEEEVTVVKIPKAKGSKKQSSVGSDAEDEELAKLKSPNDLNDTLPTPLKSRLSNKSRPPTERNAKWSPEVLAVAAEERQDRHSAATNKSDESSVYLDIDEDDVQIGQQDDSRPKSVASVVEKEVTVSAAVRKPSKECQTVEVPEKKKKVKTVDSCVGSDISFRDAACSPVPVRLLDEGYGVSREMAVQTKVEAADVAAGQDFPIQVKPQATQVDEIVAGFVQPVVVDVLNKSLEAHREALEGIGLEIVPVEQVEQQQVLKVSPQGFPTPRKPHKTGKPKSVRSPTEVKPTIRAKSRHGGKTKSVRQSTEAAVAEKTDHVSRRISCPQPSTSQQQARQLSPELAVLPGPTRQREKAVELAEDRKHEVEEAAEVSSKENTVVVLPPNSGSNSSGEKKKNGRSLDEMLPILSKRFQRDPAYILYVVFACSGSAKAIVNFLTTLQKEKRAPETPFSFLVDRLLLREGEKVIEDLLLRTDLTRPQLEGRLAYLLTHQQDKTPEEAIKTIRMLYNHSETGDE